jgi:hypothetical protein
MRSQSRIPSGQYGMSMTGARVRLRPARTPRPDANDRHSPLPAALLKPIVTRLKRVWFVGAYNGHDCALEVIRYLGGGLPAHAEEDFH